MGRATSARAHAQATARTLEGVVTEAERAFAAAMARRDLAAFGSFVSEEAVFLGSEGNRRILRGRRAVVEAWKAFFESPTASFSWSPDLVQVLDSGRLALSSGPVRSAEGAVTNRFTSVWRLQDDGKWRVVFDRGSPVCAKR